MANRNQKALTEEDLCFAEIDVLVHQLSGVHGDEQRVAKGFYLWPLVSVVRIFDGEIVQGEFLLQFVQQGFGRLIRTEGDSGVCAILDSRARNGASYHDRVVAALPFCHTSSSISDVRQFMADRKPAAYFK